MRIEEVIEEVPVIIPQAKKNTGNKNGSVARDQTPQIAQKEPEHPYRNVKDVAYITPTQPNVGSVPKTAPKRNDIAY